MILIKELFSINLRYMKNTTSFLSTNIVSAKRAICNCAIAELLPSLQQRVICVEFKVNSLWLPREQWSEESNPVATVLDCVQCPCTQRCH